MADISDVTAYFATQVSGVVYPNGSSSASIAPVPPGYSNPMDVLVYEGWPIPQQLDLDMQAMMLPPGAAPQTPPIPRPNGPRAHVSIFPMGMSREPYQILNRQDVIVNPGINLTVTTGGEPGASDCIVTITGTPAAGEYVTIIADRQFIYSETGSTAAAILSALLTDAQVNYPTASLSGSTLTIPAFFAFVVRQGGQGVIGRVIFRECQKVMVTVWAPDHNTRSILAENIDVVLKENIVVTMSDTSQAKIVYSGTKVTDDMQNVTVYRRDLFYDVEYATLQTFPGWVITSVTATDQFAYNPPLVTSEVTNVY